ncbi:Integrase [Mucinivorans hirudinis]|uniref:Integrase n=1 Tax=Mucinivorans hirudinis TaxID=1433126 RepID=A0A060R8W1_9BACT|nr:Integrase [Mucinivorans hirudinis]
MVGVSQNLTTYVARHSWATVAKEKGISVAIISEGLGHCTESVTNVYLKSFDQVVLDEANSQVSLL